MPMITAGFLQWCNVYSFSKPVPSLSNGGKKQADFQHAKITDVKRILNLKAM